MEHINTNHRIITSIATALTVSGCLTLLSVPSSAAGEYIITKQLACTNTLTVSKNGTAISNIQFQASGGMPPVLPMPGGNSNVQSGTSYQLNGMLYNLLSGDNFLTATVDSSASVGIKGPPASFFGGTSYYVNVILKAKYENISASTAPLMGAFGNCVSSWLSSNLSLIAQNGSSQSLPVSYSAPLPSWIAMDSGGNGQYNNPKAITVLLSLTSQQSSTCAGAIKVTIYVKQILGPNNTATTFPDP